MTTSCGVICHKFSCFLSFCITWLFINKWSACFELLRMVFYQFMSFVFILSSAFVILYLLHFFSFSHELLINSFYNFLIGQDMSKCTFTGHKVIGDKHKPLVLKELKHLWNKADPNLPWEQGEFSPSNTLLVDDSPYKALCNPVLSSLTCQGFLLISSSIFCSSTFLWLFCFCSHTLQFSRSPTVLNQKDDFSLGMLQHIAMLFNILFCHILLFRIQDLVETCVCILRDLLLQMMFKFLFVITRLVSHPLQIVIPSGISIQK